MRCNIIESPAEARDLVKKLRLQQRVLAELGPEGRIAELRRALTKLFEEAADLRSQLIAEISRERSLSPEMVRCGLRESLAPVVEDNALSQVWQEFDALCLGRVPVLPRAMLVWLAGNIFVAPLRATVVPIVCGMPVVARVSERNSACVRHLKRVLTETSTHVSAAFRPIMCEHVREDTVRELLGSVDVLEAYGSDTTLAALKRLAPASLPVAEHGHGFGVAVVDASEAVRQRHQGSLVPCAEALACDVAAYEGRGCLSPKAVLLVGSDDAAHAFADTLAQALDRRAETLPPPPLDDATAAELAQWEGVAAVRGRCFFREGRQGSGHKARVAVEPLPVRPAPGHRAVTIYPVSSWSELTKVISHWGNALKIIGTNADPDTVRELAASLSFPSAPSFCKLGHTQRPGWTFWQDGQHPASYIKFLQI